eukprot:scaffold14773_cov106-Isochrysis_galbana.AAC.2
MASHPPHHVREDGHSSLLCEAPLKHEPLDLPPVTGQEGAEQIELAPLAVQLDEAHLVGQHAPTPKQGDRRHPHRLAWCLSGLVVRVGPKRVSPGVADAIAPRLTQHQIARPGLPSCERQLKHLNRGPASANRILPRPRGATRGGWQAQVCAAKRCVGRLGLDRDDPCGPRVQRHAREDADLRADVEQHVAARGEGQPGRPPGVARRRPAVHAAGGEQLAEDVGVGAAVTEGERWVALCGEPRGARLEGGGARGFSRCEPRQREELARERQAPVRAARGVKQQRLVTDGPDGRRVSLNSHTAAMVIAQADQQRQVERWGRRMRHEGGVAAHRALRARFATSGGHGRLERKHRARQLREGGVRSRRAALPEGARVGEGRSARTRAARAPAQQWWVATDRWSRPAAVAATPRGTLAARSQHPVARLQSAHAHAPAIERQRGCRDGPQDMTASPGRCGRWWPSPPSRELFTDMYSQHCDLKRTIMGGEGGRGYPS